MTFPLHSCKRSSAASESKCTNDYARSAGYPSAQSGSAHTASSYTFADDRYRTAQNTGSLSGGLHASVNRSYSATSEGHLAPGQDPSSLNLLSLWV